VNLAHLKLDPTARPTQFKIESYEDQNDDLERSNFFLFFFTCPHKGRGRSNLMQDSQDIFFTWEMPLHAKIRWWNESN
jgi:hypothetical protein